MMWLWLWLAFVLVFLLIPVGYGWGYRRRGFPYPSHYYRRRHVEGRETREWDPDPESAGQPSGWGRGGDLVWLLFLVALIWIGIVLWTA